MRAGFGYVVWEHLHSTNEYEMSAVGGTYEVQNSRAST